MRNTNDFEPKPSRLEREIMAWVRGEEGWMYPLMTAIGIGVLFFVLL